MASGEHKWPAVIEDELPVGSVVTTSGRVSAVHRAGAEFPELPFTQMELIRLDNALTDATRRTKVRFNVYLGDLGEDFAAGVDHLFPSTPEARRSVLLAVLPNQRAVEIRSGRDVSDRANDRVLQLGVTAAVASLGDGDLIDGIVASIRVMAAAIASA
ncbi:DUF5130 domain-containing protein [Skermania sp. ID1734]|uniref:DUF5130 domain-containing protein n=1 Tax=Skermania sp. ID1734 TaxID=2597516 RepID=UPI00117F6A02|nr:DUF5130 domain-containing protein [Skermania sp. ID1734]TSD99992.1 DUF5130 domain-containing protein [Skermania sp. ID1734]